MNELGCDLLHLTDLTPPLINPPKLVISPAADGEGTRPAGFRTRLRGALARGGAARAAGWLLPEDVPPPPQASRPLRLPPVVHPAFLSPNPLPLEIPGKPHSYILFHAPAGEAALARALQAWTWAAGPIGEAYPLLMAGLDEPARRFAARLAENYKLGETVIFLPPSAPPSLPALYQRAAVIFHPAESPAWGGAVRRALACGKPFVGLDTPVSAALAGPAAYLVPAGDARKLGAALLGVVVKESLQKQLGEAALARAAAWDGEAYRKKLGEVYAGM
jgi:glycosyltransferase involved in cell wall biosynthesis